MNSKKYKRTIKKISRHCSKKQYSFRITFLAVFLAIAVLYITGLYTVNAPSISDGTSTYSEYSASEIANSYKKYSKFKIPDNWISGTSAINNNKPFFDDSDIGTARSMGSFEYYAPLDVLGRCGVTCANLSLETMPDTARESIGMVKPTGWHTVKYDNIEGRYLYNRCHLIGYQLSGENANTSNLITGTRFLNADAHSGMLYYENLVADYIKKTGNHVLYRVIPWFGDNNMLAYGVSMEAYSIEDSGHGICFCVFVPNIQPGIEIDYITGNSSLAG